MRAYYASKISPNISKMPKEGYLICRNVPIARTGSQEYYGYELGPDFEPDKAYPVYRTEAEVFDPKAIASFEGKPATDDHPNEDVTSENVTLHIKGTTTNVRRGEGAESNLLLADLIIYDQILIDEIMNGKREVSCGYDCITEAEGDRLIQKNIRGNHVAVVDAGRAGSDVSIKDQKPTNVPKTISIRRKNHMPKMTLADKFARFLGMTKDADPEEAAAVLAEMAAQELKADEETPPAKDNAPPSKSVQNSGQDEERAQLGPVLEAVKALTGKVDELSAKVDSIQTASTGDTDPLATLEAELAKELGDEEAGEAEHTTPAENIDEEPTDDEESTTDEDTQDEDAGDEDPTADNEPSTSTADKQMLLDEIRRMRPIVAGMKDGKAKQAITDSLLRMGKAAKGVSGSGKNGYKQMADARADALKKRVQTKAKSQRDAEAEDEQQQAKYDAFNPHLKKGE